MDNFETKVVDLKPTSLETEAAHGELDGRRPSRGQ